jgi:outer membrane receptor protein involved in Fe transport
VGVISSAEVDANGGQLLVTYVNVDENIDFWGSDISARVLLNGGFSIAASGSFVSEDRWQTQNAGLVTLNAPARKATLALAYDDGEGSGLSGEARMRYTSGFPVNSGVYVGLKCLPDASTSPLAEDCVSAYTLFDMNFGYRLPVRGRRTTLQVSATNLFGEAYRPFPGTPSIGRTVLARIKYDF